MSKVYSCNCPCIQSGKEKNGDFFRCRSCLNDVHFSCLKLSPSVRLERVKNLACPWCLGDYSKCQFYPLKDGERDANLCEESHTSMNYRYCNTVTFHSPTIRGAALRLRRICAQIEYEASDLASDVHRASSIVSNAKDTREHVREQNLENCSDEELDRLDYGFDDIDGDLLLLDSKDMVDILNAVERESQLSNGRNSLATSNRQELCNELLYSVEDNCLSGLNPNSVETFLNESSSNKSSETIEYELESFVGLSGTENSLNNLETCQKGEENETTLISTENKHPSSNKIRLTNESQRDGSISEGIGAGDVGKVASSITGSSLTLNCDIVTPKDTLLPPSKSSAPISAPTPAPTHALASASSLNHSSVHQTNLSQQTVLILNVDQQNDEACKGKLERDLRNTNSSLEHVNGDCDSAKEGEVEVEVEMIVKHGINSVGAIVYELKFKNQPSSENLWFHEEYLTNCKSLLNAYKRLHKIPRNGKLSFGAAKSNQVNEQTVDGKAQIVNTKNWTCVDDILRLVRWFERHPTFNEELEIVELTDRNLNRFRRARKDRLYIYIRWYHAFVLVHLPIVKTVYIADGGNQFLTNQLVNENLKQILGVEKCVGISFDQQTRIDHCGSSAVCILIECKRLYRRYKSYNEPWPSRISVPKERYNTIKRHLHRYPSEPLPSAHTGLQSRQIRTCRKCRKKFLKITQHNFITHQNHCKINAHHLTNNY